MEPAPTASRRWYLSQLWSATGGDSPRDKPSAGASDRSLDASKQSPVDGLRNESSRSLFGIQRQSKNYLTLNDLGELIWRAALHDNGTDEFAFGQFGFRNESEQFDLGSGLDNSASDCASTCKSQSIDKASSMRSCKCDILTLEDLVARFGFARSEWNSQAEREQIDDLSKLSGSSTKSSESTGSRLSFLMSLIRWRNQSGNQPSNWSSSHSSIPSNNQFIPDREASGHSEANGEALVSDTAKSWPQWLFSFELSRRQQSYAYAKKSSSVANSSDSERRTDAANRFDAANISENAAQQAQSSDQAKAGPDLDSTTDDISELSAKADTEKAPKSTDTQLKDPLMNHLLPPFDMVAASDLRSLASSLISPVTGKWGDAPNFWKICKSKKSFQCQKAVVIGVHGYFPSAFVRTIMGPPTGTSEKLSSMAADSIERWSDRQKAASGNVNDTSVAKIALHAEGRIEDRVESMWQQLQPFRQMIEEAELVFVAAHSQGAPVSIHLMQRLLMNGWIRDKAKVGICAVAGCHLGPMPSIKKRYLLKAYSTFEKEISSEIFELQNISSTVSRNYISALQYCLTDPRLKLTLVGSIDDQLIPVYSSLLTNVLHPSILRGISLDVRYHGHDFLAKLVEFACCLASSGIFDHNLLLSLSVPMAGSFYGGEGHSRIYNDPQVYDFAMRHTVETESTTSILPRIGQFDIHLAENPYLLPWAMHSILRDPDILKRFGDEMFALSAEYLKWNPKTRASKDIQYRLEAFKNFQW